MKIFILTGNKKLSEALAYFVGNCFNDINPEFSYGYFGDVDSINPEEWRDSELLITEAINPKSLNNPEGWRTAKKSNKKALVIFYLHNKDFNPEEYFVVTRIEQLHSKLENVIKMPPAEQKDYNRLEEEYPFLKRTPRHH